MLLKDINKKIRHNEKIEDDMLYQIVYGFIEYYKLEKYLKYIDIIDENEEERYGYYSPMESYLEISKCTFSEEIERNYKNLNSIYTTETIRRLYHELVHVLQYRIVKEGEPSVYKRIFVNDFDITDMDEYGHKYYDCSTELNADFISCMQALDIVRLKSFGLIDFNMKCFESSYYLYKYLKIVLKKFYSYSSPVERSNIKIDNNEYMDRTNYEKISLGLPIDEELRGKILTLNEIEFKNLRNI